MNEFLFKKKVDVTNKAVTKIVSSTPWNIVTFQNNPPNIFLGDKHF